MFERGGFDIAIGNPPYVRMEHIKSIKPYLEKHYRVAADRADLYAYFYERGVGLLKEGGRLGFISSSTFFRTGSGEPLRRFLSERTAIESIVDFGDAQLFEGVTTYPAIVTLRKTSEGAGDLAYLIVKAEAPADLGRAFREGSRTMPRTRLTAASWRVEDEALARLRDKIANGSKTLGEVYGAPLYGIKTGFNDAFIIDAPTRDRLVRADPKSAELLKPFLRGENVTQIPIPMLPTSKRVRLGALGQACTDAARERFEVQSAVRRRILDLAPREHHKLTVKLHDWHELDFATFRAEIKHAFHADVPLRERGEWETYLSENVVRVRQLSDRIATSEREIDQIVYWLFDLTHDETTLLESSIGGQY